MRPPRSVHRATLPGLPRSLRDYEQQGLDAATELSPGCELVDTKRFEIVDRVGEGGMGKVYRAYDPRLDRYVAIKVLKLDVPAVARRRFQREAMVAAGFSHPNLARVLDVGRSDEIGIEWLTMEYLRGRDLGQIIDRVRPVALPLTLDIMGQVLDALEYVHLRKIVHCDIKPENIFVTRDPYNRRLVIVKLIDFGVYRSLEPYERPTELSGDPRYMAPEQTVLDGPFDHRADFYALGVTLYEILTGRHPFDEYLDRDPRELLALQCRTDIPPPSERLGSLLSPKLLNAIDQLVARATAKKPADRFDDAAQMKQALLCLPTLG